MTDLQFINLEGPHDHSKPQIRAFVRGHVMKRFHNQRRAKLRLQSRQGNKSPLQVDARLLHTVPTSSAEDILQLSRSGEFSPRQVPQAFAPVSYTHKRKRYTTSPVSALEAGYDDPFTSLPIQMDPYKCYLIHHYSSFVTPVIFPFLKRRASNPMRAKFLPLCITNPALLKAVLVAASTNLVHSGLHDSRIVAICRGGAIRLINDALQDKEDATIAAVVHLAFAELMNGDLASWEVHMKGLEKMIEMKGGPQSLGLDGLMHHIIYSIDSCGATMNQTKPRFTPLRKPLTSIPQLLFQGCPYVAIGSGIRTLANSSSISMGLVNILEDMSYLTTFLELPGQSSTGTQQMRYFDALSLIEHRILSVPISNDTQYGAINSGNIDETCRLAALIYINIVFRELQPTSAVHATLANRLRISLMQTDLKSCWGTLSEALLWILFIGGSVAMQEPTKSWLMSALENVCSHLKLQSWCNARDILSKYLWCDRIWEERCKSIWDYVNLRE